MKSKHYGSWRLVPSLSSHRQHKGTGVQRRNGVIDQLRPQRWNWYALVHPIDRAVARQTDHDLSREQVRGLRYLWLDGLFTAISDNFFLVFIPLFALAYGATNAQVGWITAIGNLLGALAVFPGARMADSIDTRKRLVVWTGGGVGRLMLVGLALVPLLFTSPALAILAIVLFNGMRAFMSNLANPAWTAMVADLIPDFMRGRYLGSRTTAMGVAALLVVPAAGWIVRTGNGWFGLPYLGYQAIFALAFLFGMVSTISFARIPEPAASTRTVKTRQRGDLRRALTNSPGFVGLVASAFVWNLALQVAAPFFNVYLVSGMGASAAMVGLVTSVSSLTALAGLYVFGKLLDGRGAIFVQTIAGVAIPLLPLAWMVITAPWQVAIINTFGGFLWAGYNLANFNLLLELTPNEQRPRAVALYQVAVFGSAVLGPLAGGYLADLVSFDFIFGLSGVGRFLGILIFFWWTARPALAHGKGVAFGSSVAA